MIINNLLNHLFTSPSVISVLRVLNQRNAGSTGREIARLSNITHRTAIKALDNLEAINLVTRKIAGKSYYYTINRNQYIYNEIVFFLFEKEKEFKQKIFNNIKSHKYKNLASIIIFGSVARKEESVKSDLDVCFVYSKSKTSIEDIVNIQRDYLYTKYGVKLAPFYITEKNFKLMAKKNKSPVKNIIKEGIVIYGKSMNRLMYGKKNYKKKN